MLNLQAVRDIAAETDIHPGFIEKDWYAVQLLARLSSFQNSNGVSLILSGGTSLSKGHGVIRRLIVFPASSLGHAIRYALLAISCLTMLSACLPEDRATIDTDPAALSGKVWVVEDIETTAYLIIHTRPWFSVMGGSAAIQIATI